MKKNKKLAVVMALLLTLTMAGGTGVAFGDIDYSQWDSGGTSGQPKDLQGTSLYSQAKAFLDKGVITGDTDGLFHPERTIKRSEFAAIIARATNNASQLNTSEQAQYFGDLKGYSWAKGYINRCYEVNLMQGVGNSRFNPGGTISYQEVMTAILRAKGINDATMAAYGTWPHNYIKYTQLYNLTGTVRVTDWAAPITKGEVVQLMYKNMPKSTVDTPSIVIATNTVGTTVTATVTVTGTGTHTFQWYDGSGLIAGATSSTYSWTTGSGSYYVKVTTSKTGYEDVVFTSAMYS
jgi:hypothetical protein